MKLMPQGDFDKVYQLMEVSFSSDEHRTYEEEKELLCRSEYEIYVLPDETSDDIKAFMAVWEFDSIVYLEHFAVNPKFRNEGIGSDMIQELLRMFSKKICLEVELPEEKLAARRIEFYRRNFKCQDFRIPVLYSYSFLDMIYVMAEYLMMLSRNMSEESDSDKKQNSKIG